MAASAGAELGVLEKGAFARVAAISLRPTQSGTAAIASEVRIVVTGYQKEGLPHPSSAIAEVSLRADASDRDARKLAGFTAYLRHGATGTGAPRGAVADVQWASGEKCADGSLALPSKVLLVARSSGGEQTQGDILVHSTSDVAASPAPLTHTPSASAGADVGKIASRAAMDDLSAPVYQGLAAVPEESRGKVRFLFRFLKPAQQEQLWVDKVALYSVTQAAVSRTIAEAAWDAVQMYAAPSAQPCIVDAMACVGGDTLSFAQIFPRVFSVEVSSSRAECLAHNVIVAGVAESVTTMCGNALSLIQSAKAGTAAAKGPSLPAHVSAVYFDPPWGGPEYAKAAAVSMYVGDVHLGDALRQCVGWADVAVVKAPMNFDIPGTLQRAGPTVRLTAEPTKLRKMQLLILQLKPAEAGETGAAPPSAKKPRRE